MYRYAEAFGRLGLARYLAHEHPGYWGLLTSAQLAGLCRELGQTLYIDCRAVQAWLAQAYGVAYSVSGLTDLLHPPRFLLQAHHARALRGRLLGRAVGAAAGPGRSQAGGGVFCRRGPPHPQRALHPGLDGQRPGLAWPLPTVSGRERVNRNAALNAHCPAQVHVDETDCVNAQSTRRLYEQLLAAHPGQRVVVVCDNARYYKNREPTAGWPTSPWCNSFCRPIRPI